MNGKERHCLWLLSEENKQDELFEVLALDEVANRVEKVKQMRLESKKSATRELAGYSLKLLVKFGNLQKGRVYFSA